MSFALGADPSLVADVTIPWSVIWLSQSMIQWFSHVICWLAICLSIGTLVSESQSLW